MSKTISIWSRIIDLIAPRACIMCRKRLSITEECICVACNLKLPRTYHYLHPFDNNMARLFWGRLPVEHCAAYIYFKPHSPSSYLVYNLKYFNHPEVGHFLGKMMAQEYGEKNFFSPITAILPMPIARNRMRERGYNQSYEVAKGIQSQIDLPIITDAIERKKFKASQTKQNKWGRLENVENAFILKNKSLLNNQHILIIDDVVTTGATTISLGKAILQAENVKISILAVGYVSKL